VGSLNRSSTRFSAGLNCTDIAQVNPALRSPLVPSTVREAPKTVLCLTSPYWQGVLQGIEGFVGVRRAAGTQLLLVYLALGTEYVLNHCVPYR
jgi:hypothetical protein